MVFDISEREKKVIMVEWPPDRLLIDDPKVAIVGDRSVLTRKQSEEVVRLANEFKDLGFNVYLTNFALDLDYIPII